MIRLTLRLICVCLWIYQKWLKDFLNIWTSEAVMTQKCSLCLFSVLPFSFDLEVNFSESACQCRQSPDGLLEPLKTHWCQACVWQGGVSGSELCSAGSAPIFTQNLFKLLTATLRSDLELLWIKTGFMELVYYNIIICLQPVYNCLKI